MTKVKTESAAEYTSAKSKVNDDEIIKSALKILEQRIKKPQTFIGSSEDAVNFLNLKLSQLEYEVFAVMFLNTKNGVTNYVEMFTGTIDGASVYPREVIKKALELNAAAIICGHNHPSGEAVESQADIRITHRLRDACNLVDIRLLDHIIVAGSETNSLADKGII